MGAVPWELRHNDQGGLDSQGGGGREMCVRRLKLRKKRSVAALHIPFLSNEDVGSQILLRPDLCPPPAEMT